MCVYTHIDTHKETNEQLLVLFSPIRLTGTFVNKMWRLWDSWHVTIFPEDSGKYVFDGN